MTIKDNYPHYQIERRLTCYSYPKSKKKYNKSHSKKRIVIEHTICKLKKYKILADVFRNKLRKYDRISDIVSGMVNYRIMNPS